MSLQNSVRISPELLACLRELEKNPLTRLSPQTEEELLALGLIRRWAGFIAITELGRTVLAENDGGSAGA